MFLVERTENSGCVFLSASLGGQYVAQQPDRWVA